MSGHLSKSRRIVKIAWTLGAFTKPWSVLLHFRLLCSTTAIWPITDDGTSGVTGHFRVHHEDRGWSELDLRRAGDEIVLGELGHEAYPGVMVADHDHLIAMGFVEEVGDAVADGGRAVGHADVGGLGDGQGNRQTR